MCPMYSAMVFAMPHHYITFEISFQACEEVIGDVRENL